MTFKIKAKFYSLKVSAINFNQNTSYPEYLGIPVRPPWHIQSSYTRQRAHHLL